MRNIGKNLLEFVPDFTVIDLEMTGRGNELGDITEISAIRYRNYKPVSKYSKLIKARRKVLPFVVGLTGISDELLVGAPRIEMVIDEFVEFLGNDIILGHNVEFDLKVVEKAYRQIEGKNLSHNYIDTLRISRLLNPDSENHKLETLCKYFGVVRLIGHRGIEDCEQTAEVYIKMREKFEVLAR